MESNHERILLQNLATFRARLATSANKDRVRRQIKANRAGPAPGEEQLAMRALPLSQHHPRPLHGARPGRNSL